MIISTSRTTPVVEKSLKQSRPAPARNTGPQFGTSRVKLPEGFDKAQAVVWCRTLVAHIAAMVTLIGGMDMEEIAVGITEGSSAAEVHLRHQFLQGLRRRIGGAFSRSHERFLAEANSLIEKLNVANVKLGRKLEASVNVEIGGPVLAQLVIELWGKVAALPVDGWEGYRLTGRWVTSDADSELALASYEGNQMLAEYEAEQLIDASPKLPEGYSAADAAKYKGRWTPSMEPGCGRVHTPTLSNSGYGNPRPWHSAF